MSSSSVKQAGIIQANQENQETCIPLPIQLEPVQWIFFSELVISPKPPTNLMHLSFKSIPPHYIGLPSIHRNKMNLIYPRHTTSTEGGYSARLGPQEAILSVPGFSNCQNSSERMTAIVEVQISFSCTVIWTLDVAFPPGTCWGINNVTWDAYGPFDGLYRTYHSLMKWWDIGQLYDGTSAPSHAPGPSEINMPTIELLW